MKPLHAYIHVIHQKHRTNSREAVLMSPSMHRADCLASPTPRRAHLADAAASIWPAKQQLRGNCSGSTADQCRELMCFSTMPDKQDPHTSPRARSGSLLQCHARRRLDTNTGTVLSQTATSASAGCVSNRESLQLHKNFRRNLKAKP